MSKQQELDQIQEWLADTTEELSEWEWDGDTLVVYGSEGKEVYSRQDLVDYGVI